MKHIWLFLLVLCRLNVYAQNLLRYQHINVEDGLSQSTVNWICQDRNGFIWLATGDGLNRYDGKDFISYKSRRDDSVANMKDRNINSRIFEDKYNRIWFSTDAGISYLDVRKHKTKIILDKYSAACSATILGFDSSALWAAVPTKGLFHVDLATLKTMLIPFTDTLQRSREYGVINNGVVGSRGIWICDRAGLLFFDANSNKDRRILEKEVFNSVTPLSHNRVLLTSTGSLYLFYTEKDSLVQIPINTGSVKKSEWKSAVEDWATGNVYVGELQSGNVCVFDPASLAYKFIKVQGNQVNALFIDSSRNLWVGTDGNGAFRIDIKKPKFQCLATKDLDDGVGENGFMVKSIFRDTLGKIWLGVVNHGLIIYDPRTGKKERLPITGKDDNQLISTIHKDSSGTVLVTVGNTIYWIHELTHKVINSTVVSYPPHLSPLTPVIYSVFEWKEGHYLVGTNVALTTMYPNGKERFHQHIVKDTILSHWYYNITSFSNSNNIYLGLRDGFAHLHLLTDTTYTITDFGFRDVPIRHFYKNRSSHFLWMAAEQGLIAYNEQTHKYKIFDERTGMANSFVYAMLDENDSTFWISSNNGISRVNVAYNGEAIPTVRFTNYTVRDGLQSNEFNTGAYLKEKDGTMYFGGIAGINWFHPSEIQINPYKATPAISAIYVNDSLFAEDTAVYIHELTLPFSRNTISLVVSALEYTNPAQNRFTYQLEGLDRDWVYTSNDKIRYSGLAAGTYTFRLKVSNNDGLWNDDPFVLTITILPPYWQTWWFRALIIAIALLAGYLVARYYIRQKIRARTIELEKQQALYLERMRISKDVHDDLGSGLSKISLMAAIAEKKAEPSSTLGTDIKNISTVSKELVDNMRDLVWVLNPDNMTLEQLISRLREYCSDYLENIPIEVSLQFPDSVPAMRISGEAQRNIFLTVKEAINNCIKHADATRISISITITDYVLHIIISDNGRGFDMDKGRSGNGLRNMKQRIASIHGSLSVSSSPDNSTSITISVALNKLDGKIPL